MPKYKLTYFDVWGIGEPIRFIMKYGGLEFEEYRIKDKEGEWDKIKPTTPYGQVPVLEIDGKAYAQSIPICQYLAKQVNLLGKTDLDALQINGIATAAYELRKHLSPWFHATDPKVKEEKKDNLVNNVVPFYLNKFESLAANNGGYLHGHELTYADLYFVAILDAINVLVGHDATQDYPHLKKLNEKVRSLPAISKWLKERPECVMRM